MHDQRREARMMCADMVELRWVDQQNRPQQVVALLEDISPSGACVQLDGAIPVGTEVRWDCPKQSFSGVVRYCEYREIGFFVGIEFAASCHWSQKAFKPLHLLDLGKLAAKPRKPRTAAASRTRKS
jgi:hypothetical protein